MPSITFLNQGNWFKQNQVNIPALRKTMHTLVNNHQFHVEQVCYNHPEAEEMIYLNNQHLQHDYLTDILTFDLSTEPKRIVADICISLDMIEEQAAQYKTSREAEYVRVSLHGLLHLLGYDDHRLEDQQTMRSKEEEYINLYFQQKK